VNRSASDKAAPVAQRVNVTAGIVSAQAAKTATGRVALTVQTKVAPGEMKLLDAAGAEVPVTASADGTLRADVEARRAYVLTPRTVERRPLSKEGVQFPARYVTIAPLEVETGGTTTKSAPTRPGGGFSTHSGKSAVIPRPGAVVKLGGLFLRAASVPLTWDENVKAYATELLVGYEFDDGGERPLAAPKTVTFFAEGASARIEADTVTIERSGGSGYKRVVLSTGQIEGETRFTARVGPGDELQSSVEVHREPGGLTLSMGTTRLPAFGIGTGTLLITRLGRDGQPLAEPTALEVQLSSRDLRQPAGVIIPVGKSTVETRVRTAGLGSDELVAQSGSLQAILPIDVMFPTAATIAAIVGGLLGGSARYLRNRRRSKALRWRRPLEGALVGVIFVGAAWAGLVSARLGVGVLGTPFGAFVLAALSGYLGCIVLDRIARKAIQLPAAESPLR
jgi:hypothetical protein